MSSRPKTNLAPGTICTLGHRVPVESETVWFDVNIPGAVCGVPGVVEGPQLGLVSRGGGE